MRVNWQACWRDPSYRRLALALVVSLLLHWWLIDETVLNEAEDPVTSSIDARLALAPPLPAKTNSAKSPQVKPAVEKAPPPEPETATTATEVAAPVPEAVSTAPEPVDTAGLSTSALPQTLPDENVKPETSASEEETVQPYTWVETEFDVRTDMNATVNSRPVGRSKIVYRVLAVGERYHLESLIEPLGLASLVIPNLVQTSDGVITQHGLQPTNYKYQFGNKKDKTYHAELQWDTGKINLNTAKGTKVAALQAHTQDQLSFMYQFMFVPPLQDMQLNITNGKKLDSYQYFFAGEEDLPTKMGNLRTVHIYRDNDDGDERSELWLALDYQYVPVKIRKTEQENKVYELLATSLKTEAPQPQP